MGEAPHATAARFNSATGACEPRRGARAGIPVATGVVNPRESFTLTAESGAVVAPLIRDASGMGCAVDYADLFTWTVRPGCARKDLGSIPPDVTCALRTDAGSLRNARCVSSRASTANAHSGDCTLRVPCEPQQIYATDSALLGRMRNTLAGSVSAPGSRREPTAL